MSLKGHLAMTGMALMFFSFMFWGLWKILLSASPENTFFAFMVAINVATLFIGLFATGKSGFIK